MTQKLQTRISELSQNELIEALHAHGIAPKGKYGAARWIERDRADAEAALLTKIQGEG
jgi:hypothetical protein